VLFTFPSRYWFTIGRRGVLRLGGWSPHVQTGFHVSRPTRGQKRFLPVPACHRLWGIIPDPSGSYALATGLVRFRSPLLTESRLMSFPPATEMFQFAGFAFPAYGFSGEYPLRGGLPHSEIPGSTVARTFPGLIAACHVLHRLSTPRHSPDALGYLTVPAPAARPARRPQSDPAPPTHRADRDGIHKAYPCLAPRPPFPKHRRVAPTTP
jgi:hypothetical protein